MKVLSIFIVALTVGFLGSAYPGPVKLSVVQSVIQKNLRVGFWASVGASLPEVIGSILAIRSMRWLEEVPDVLIWFQWSIIPILLLVGFFTLRNKKAPDSPEVDTATTKTDDQPASRKAFVKAMVLNICNPQLIPFWLVAAVWFNRNAELSIDSFFDEAAFTLGATAGSFAMNYLYAKLTFINRERILEKIKPQTIRLVTGWGFILLGLWQAVQAFN